MPGLRVGTDLVEIDRLRRLLDAVGRPFLDRSWTAAEQADSRGRADSLAARWAAKEAVLKALGTGVGEIPMTDIEVVAGPTIVLHGRALGRARELGLTQWAVTLTHDGGYALAFVVATGASDAIGDRLAGAEPTAPRADEGT